VKRYGEAKGRTLQITVTLLETVTISLNYLMSANSLVLVLGVATVYCRFSASTARSLIGYIFFFSWSSDGED